jgi:hypothetical protein
MNAQSGVVEVYLYFFNLGARWGGWSAPCSGRFTTGKEPDTHYTGGWVGLRVDLDERGKSRPQQHSIQSVASCCTD